MSNCSIWPIAMTLSSATTPGQSGPRSDGNEGVLYIPPKLHYYWSFTIRLFNVISRTLVGRWLTPLQKCSWCILQLLLTGLLGSGKRVVITLLSLRQVSLWLESCLITKVALYNYTEWNRPHTHTHNMIMVGILLLCKDTVGVFYSPCWLGQQKVDFYLSVHEH